MSVVGFDIGNENCVIAVVKQRGIDVLLNDESKRETPAVVSFGEKQRFFGSAGASSATTHPKSTISQVKRLIGRHFKDPDIQTDLAMLPFETCEGHDGGVMINLQYLGEGHSFNPTQILGMLLSHLRQITEKDLGTPVSDCVIGIPSYFTDLQRREYMNAATISGLKPLRLMHDGAATALGYGIYKTDSSNSGPTHVVFVDIGDCDTQVTIALFEAGRMKILAHAFDRNLGGRDFDEVLFNYFAAQFRDQYQIDVLSNIKASIRLRAACEKLKKVLSANAEAPINIECLMDEKDVKGYIKREEFEKLSSGLLERIRIPCHKALTNSGLSIGKIYSVELVGSGSRIPAITRMLHSLFRREPARTLNASECVARGCALQCAMLSPIFRVRDYEVQDSFSFSIGFSSDDGPISTRSDAVLFPKGQLFPSMKMLTLHKNNIFHMEAFYANPNELPLGVSPKISNFTIGPLPVKHAGKTKVKVRVQLNLHGIVTVDSALLIEDLKDDPVVSSGKVEEAELGHYDVGNGAEDGTTAWSKHSARTSARMNIPVIECVYGGMTEAELSKALGKESQLAQQDIKMEQTKEKKNALEAYVYETRNKILNIYRSFASESEREDISRNLQQTEEWLYDDGDDESENVYSARLDDLKRLTDPIENRYKDEEARAQATRNLSNCIEEHRMAVGSLPEKEAIIAECNKVEQWLQELTKQQDSMPKNADPVLWSFEIKKKAEALDAACKHIMRSKAPPLRLDDTKASNLGNKPDHMQVD